MVARQVTGPLSTAIVAARRRFGPGGRVLALGGTPARGGEPIVWIRPGRRLLGILPGCVDALG